MKPHVKVYTMRSCPYCTQAKALLSRNHIPFEEVLLEIDDDAAWETLEEKSGMKTMPQIFHHDHLIGGYSDLAALAKDRGLEHLKN